MLARTKILFVPVALLAAGCVSASVIPLGEQNLAPVPREEVLVYETLDDVPADAEYRKVALIRAEANDDWDDREDLVGKMREEAAKVGANAIVLRGFEDPSTGERIAEAFLGIEGEVAGECLAIRLTPRGTVGEDAGDAGAGGKEGGGGRDLPAVRVEGS